MFVGHAALAFALVASVALARGWDADRVFAVGLLAAGFAALPDVDIAYAVVGVAGVAGGDALTLASAFWSTGNLVHRAVTHSLVLAGPVALLAALRTAADARARWVAVPLALLVVAAVGAVSGALGTMVTLLFVLGAVALGEVVSRHTSLGARQVFAAGLVGLVTHPFGDLLTGEPPAMFYPLDATLVGERIALSADPTLHLLGAFGVELATVWAAVIVGCAAAGLRPTTAIRRRATLGAGYAASIALIPAPTLDLSYPFVFTVLCVGALGLRPRLRFENARRPRIGPPDWLPALVTGLSAITVAWLAYGLAYVIVG
jgi:membrane-bound metal-dependent hydrolase YbcI (DUF457 family)